MNEFVSNLKSTFEAYQESDKKAWNAIVDKANENAVNKPETRFCNKAQPFFYSGRLIDSKTLGLLDGVKYLIITMNPALSGDDDCSESAPYQDLGETLESFIDRQNNWFEELSDQRSPSMIYNFSNKSLKLLNGEDQDCENARYGYLRKHAVVVDWFPFYSKNFALKKGNDYPEERLRLILSLAKKLKVEKVLALGSEIKNSLDVIMEKLPVNDEFKEHRLDKYTLDDVLVYSYLVGYKSDEYFSGVAKLINQD